MRDAVLLKPAKLTAEEYAEIKRHPTEGRDLLRNMKTLLHAMPVVVPPPRTDGRLGLSRRVGR